MVRPLTAPLQVSAVLQVLMMRLRWQGVRSRC
jgi:hypothetical protein